MATILEKAREIKAEKDSKIIPANIRLGINAFGVAGSLVELQGETKNVTPSTVAQTITPSTGKNGITQVNVSAVTSAIDNNIQASNIKSGVTILGVQGTVQEGITPTGTISITQNGTVDVTNYASANVNVPTGGGVPTILVQTTEPATYNGIWIKAQSISQTLCVEVADEEHLVANKINFVKGNTYSTILLPSSIQNGASYQFDAVYITDSNGDVIYDNPEIYYGNGSSWVNITPTAPTVTHYRGVTVDYINKTYTLIAGNTTSVNDLKCYANRKRCNLQDDGTVTAYYGDTNYDNVGNENLQVMVEQPVVYYSLQNVELDGNNITKADYMIADGPMTGYEVHPAFTMTDGESINPVIYIGAFEATVQNSKLSSIGGGTSTPAVNQTRASFRTYANNRGSNWTQMLIQVNELEKLMMLVEYQSLNMQSVLAKGITSSSAAQSVGRTYSLDGNGTGSVSGTIPSTNSEAFTWRWRENTYGNVDKFCDAINVLNYVWYFKKTISNMTDDTSSGYINPGISASSSFRWITRFGYAQNAKWMFIPTATSSTESDSMCGDQYWGSSGNMVFASGGYWYGISEAGAFYSSADVTSSATVHYFGAGLVYIPAIS